MGLLESDAGRDHRSDVGEVRMMTAARAAGASLVVAALLAGCSAFPKFDRPASGTQITDLGGGAWSLTRRSGVFAERSYVLRSDAEQKAVAFCAEKNLAIAVLDIRTDDPDPPASSYATISFRCLKP